MKFPDKKAILIILLFMAVLLLTTPVYAEVQSNAEILPLDKNTDFVISSDELASDILSYLTEKYLDKNERVKLGTDLSDAAYIYANWNGKPKTVHDSKGQAVTLYRPLKKVAVMNGETLETIRSLGFDETKISGVGKYSLEEKVFFPEYANKTNIGSVWSPDYEKIMYLSPDAVFIYADFMVDKSDEIEEKIQSMNPSIKVFRFDLFNPSTYLEETKLLARVVDKEKEVDKLALFYEEQINLIALATGNISKEQQTRVYFESWDDYKSCATGSGYNEKINLAGGVSIFEDATPAYPLVNPEEILIKNPDVIIKLIGSGKLNFGGYEDSDAGRASGVHQTIIARAGWNNLDGVKENRVHILSNDILGGPEYIIGILYLAKWLYPEEFENVDPADVHQRYITEFQHIAFDVRENGVFVAP